MNLKQLDIFIAVAESGSFSRAAELTHITQSTVSQHVSSLENEYGLKLLDRTGKGALLTEAGKLLLDHARCLTKQAREIPAIIRRFKGLEDVNLKLGGSNIPGNYIIPSFLPLFHIENPGVTVVLLIGDSRETIERLTREECELAMVGCSFEGEDIVYETLIEDNIRLVMNSNHHLYGRESVLFKEIADESFIFREPGSGTDRTVRTDLATAGLAVECLKVHSYLGSNEAVKHAVISGAGISFVSELSVRKECERGELGMVRVEGVDITRKIFLARRRGRELSPAALSFISLIVKHIQHDSGKVDSDI